MNTYQLSKMFSKENFKLFISLFLAGLLIVFLLKFAKKIIPPEPSLLPQIAAGLDGHYEEDIASRMSFGERILVDKECYRIQKDDYQVFKVLKTVAVELIKKKDYEEAISYFKLARKFCANTPETSIYLNNAEIGNQESYTIAILVHSSVDDNKALDILRGFAQAQWEINQKGGINGILVKLLVINDDDDPEIAKQIANYLVGKDDILAVTGHWTSDVSLAVAPIYKQERLVFITPNSSTNKLSDYENYVFQINMSNEKFSTTLAEYVVENWEIKKVAIFYVKGTAYTEELKEGFTEEIKKLGGEVVETFDFSDSRFDAEFSFKKANNSVAEGLFLITDNKNIDKAIKVIRVNSRKLKLLAESNLYTESTLTQAKQDALGLVMGISRHVDDYLYTQFVNNAQERWGTKSVNYVTARSYNTMQVLIKALQSNQNPSRKTIQQALKATDFAAQGAGEIVEFTDKGTREGEVQLVEVRPKETGNGYEFVPIN